MAKRKTPKNTNLSGPETTFEEDINLDQTYSKAETFITKNKVPLFAALGLVLLLAIAYYGYNNVYLPPKENNASTDAINAQKYFQMDSFNLALNGDGNSDGFLDIIDNYGGTKMGNLANYYAGVSYLNLGQYDEAIDYLSAFNGDDMVVSSMALGAIGDAYMEKGETDQGISYYEKAASNNDNNFTSPMYHFRAGLAKLKANDNEGAKKHFEIIKEKYKTSAEARDIEKYIARVSS